MPAYWLMYNQFALERNAWKCESRDKRSEKTQFLESHYLAPDTINSIFEALKLLELHAGKYFCAKNFPDKVFTDAEYQTYGREYLSTKTDKPSSITLSKHSIENSSRQVKLLKPVDSYLTYHDYITYYALDLIIDHCRKNPGIKIAELLELINNPVTRQNFENIGGQMIPAIDLNQMKEKIMSYEIISWLQVHEFYITQGKTYASQKLKHAISALQELNSNPLFEPKSLKEMLDWYQNFRKKLLVEIRHSRQKDYENPFRLMLYADKKEMEAVIGKLEKTPFIIQQQEKLKKDITFVEELTKRLGLAD
jgi:hypothetical protein